MSEATRDTLLDQARDAASRGDWREAHALLAGADERGLLSGPDLPFLANVAYAAGHPDQTIEVWERIHADSLRAGDHPAAAGAAVRIALHLLLDTALMAPVRGWLARVERLLEGQPDSAIHAWLAVVRNYERMLSGDFPAARQWARRAIELGLRWDQAATAIGRVAEARSLILEGEVRQGLRLLDEAAVVTVSGELDPFSTGMVYCELVCALQALAQYDRAEEWTEAMERYTRRSGIGSIHGRCRVHRAEILRLRGSLNEAERQAVEACDELRPYLRREMGWPLTELGRIRLQKGDVGGAEDAFRAAHQVGWDPQPGLALVHLTRGDTAQAVAMIRDALERPANVPSKELPPNTDLRRAPLLAAQSEIEIAAGHLDRARSAAEELQGIAARFESKVLTASALLARARVRLAEGSAPEAHRDFEAAAHLSNEVRTPYEMAIARLGLAAALRAEGSEPEALLELQAARSMLKQIGAAHLAEAPAAEEPVAAHVNIFRREGDYWSITFDGRLVRMRDLKGLRYLARLLADPGREFHALELTALESGEPVPTDLRFQDSGEILDPRAKEAYRRRLAEIDEDLAQAASLGDPDRTARAEAERTFVRRELSRAVGLGGRDRRASSASERARAAVTRALRQALTRIRTHDALLAKHLDRTVRTGTYCAYLPDPRTPAAWIGGVTG
jgi:tetratricopeptide (TPR) repeat protein